MADVELLPCPWCGEALHSVIVTEGSTFRWRKVDGCCADGPEVRHDTMADDQVAAEEDSRRRAIEAWNTRANLAPLQAENERLRAEVELWRHKAAIHKYRRKRLAEALRDARRALAFAAQHLPECNEPYERANAALAQEDRNG